MGPIQTQTFVCCVCGQTKAKEPGGFTTGYGCRRESGEKVCYACCAEETKAEMRDGKRQCLYLTKDKAGAWRVTNWPGSLLIAPVKVKSSTFRGFGWQPIERNDVWFLFEGRPWYGVNKGDNELLRCRPLKGGAR